jgi:hypothetical protein
MQRARTVPSSPLPRAGQTGETASSKQAGGRCSAKPMSRLWLRREKGDRQRASSRRLGNPRSILRRRLHPHRLLVRVHDNNLVQGVTSLGDSRVTGGHLGVKGRFRLLLRRAGKAQTVRPYRRQPFRAGHTPLPQSMFISDQLLSPTNTDSLYRSKGQTLSA